MKNQNGISLIALIITIIVIIILAAIVIGGVFNTPNDAKFAAFCQEYDRVQTAIQVKYYDLYLDYSISQATDVLPTHFNLYNEVATGVDFMATDTTDSPTQAAADDTNNWTEITNWKDTTNTDGVCEKPDLDGKWFLRESDGKLVYEGFERGEKEMYVTPNLLNTVATTAGNRALVSDETTIVAANTELAL